MRGHWQHIGRVLVAFSMVYVSVGATARSAMADAPDDAAQRELVRYLLVAANGNPTGQPRNVDLFPQAVPGDLPLPLPSPPDARLVGSATYHTRTATTSWDVLYDSTSTAQETADFYAGALPPLGWILPPPDDRPARGFAPASPATPNRGAFCTDGYTLLTSGGATALSTRFIRVHIDTAPLGVCTRSSAASRPTMLDYIPALAPPARVRVAVGSAPTTPTLAFSTAIATTDMSVRDLEAFYAGQLIAAGWVRTAGSADGPLAWSAWRVPDFPGAEGFLSVLVAPGTDRRDLLIQLQGQPASPTP